MSRNEPMEEEGPDEEEEMPMPSPKPRRRRRRRTQQAGMYGAIYVPSSCPLIPDIEWR